MRTFVTCLIAKATLIVALLTFSVTSTNAATILLVTDGNGTLTSNESSYKSYLESLGHTVPTVWDNASQATIDTAWASANVVYVPYSVTDWELGDKLRLCTKGVVCEERYLDDNLGLSTQPGWDTTSYTAINITDNSHYITSPFSTGSLTIFTSSQPMTLMNPTHASGLVTLADQHFGNKALAIVDVGATLANTVSGNSTAAGRRVHLPWGGDTFNIASLNASTQTLGLRAIQWAMSDGRLLHWKLDETSGTTASDSSGQGRNGTVAGTASWISGRRKNGFGLNGSTRVEVTNLLNSPTNFTVACWAKVDAADSSGAEGVSIGDYVVLRLHDGTAGGPQGRFYVGSSTWRTVSLAKSYVGRGWHHFAVTFDNASDNLKLWIDGVNVATTSTTSTVTWSGLGTKTVVGQHGNAGTSHDLTGAVDDVRVYDKALTQTEIADVYGLVGWWKLVETSGTTATDSSGKALNGTYTNGPTVAQAGPYPGAGVYAASFDGTDDYAAGVASSNYSSLTDGFTISGWVRLNAFVDYGAILENGSTTNACYLAFSTSGQIRLMGRSSGGAQLHTTTATIPLATWKHVVGTYDGATFKVYVDGALVSSASSAFTISTPAGNLSVGAALQGGAKYLNGRLHDVRFYNRAIAAEEAAELYGLIGRWRLAETSGTAAADSSGIVNNGTYTSGPTLAQAGPYPGNGQYAPGFDGSNDHVVVGNISSSLSSGFSYAAWVRPTAVAYYQRIVDFGNGADVDNLYFGREGTNNDLRLSIKDGSSGNTSITATGVLETNVWHHYVATCDNAGNGVLYRDGVIVASGALGTPGDVVRTINYIARSNWSGDAYFQGNLQDVRLYNRPLSTAEVADIYGLVGHWKFDEGSGTSFADSSGAGGNAVVNSGAPSWISTIYGNGLQFNGTSDDVRTSSSFAPPSVGTVAFWMQPNGTPASIQRILGNGGDWEVRQYTDGLVYLDLCGDNSVSTNFVTVSAPTSANRWYHILGTYDSADDSYAVYVNGVLERSGTSIVNLVAQAANNLSIGTRTGATERFAGKLDDVRVYNRKMSAWEVYQVYGLMAWYKLDETSGTVAADSTGRGQDGAYSGSPTLNVSANGATSQGTAVGFNGANYMQASGLYDKSSSVTAAAWVRLDGVDSAGADAVSLGDCFVLRLSAGASGAKIGYYNGSTYVWAAASQTILNSGWHHFAGALRSGDTLKLYIDGVEAASVAVSGAISYTGQGSNTRVASHANGSTTTDLTGRVDDVRIFNRAMASDEIFQLYHGSRIPGVKILQWVEAH